MVKECHLEMESVDEVLFVRGVDSFLLEKCFVCEKKTRTSSCLEVIRPKLGLSHLPIVFFYDNDVNFIF